MYQKPSKIHALSTCARILRKDCKGDKEKKNIGRHICVDRDNMEIKREMYVNEKILSSDMLSILKHLP